jgi:MFS family permease
MVFVLVGGWLSDRFRHKRIIALAGLVAALGTLIALLSPSLTIIYIGGCLIGVATGMFYTANWALGTKLVPKEQAGRYLGISNLAGAGAGAVGAYIGGPIADFFTAHVPDAPGLGYVLLFAIYGTLFLLSIAALNWVREPARTV